MPSVLRWVPAALRAVAMAAVLGMVLLVVADVVMRGLFNSPIQGTLELMTYWFMVVISFLGMWLAQVKREHITVTMITDRLRGPAKMVFRVFSAILTVAFLAALGWYGLEAALINMARGEYTGAFRVPIWPMRFLVPIGLGAYAITLIIHTIQDLKNPDDVEDDVLAGSGMN